MGIVWDIGVGEIRAGFPNDIIGFMAVEEVELVGPKLHIFSNKYYLISCAMNFNRKPLMLHDDKLILFPYQSISHFHNLHHHFKNAFQLLDLPIKWIIVMNS